MPNLAIDKNATTCNLNVMYQFFIHIILIIVAINIGHNKLTIRLQWKCCIQDTLGTQSLSIQLAMAISKISLLYFHFCMFQLHICFPSGDTKSIIIKRRRECLTAHMLCVIAIHNVYNDIHINFGGHPNS